MLEPELYESVKVNKPTFWKKIIPFLVNMTMLLLDCLLITVKLTH